MGQKAKVQDKYIDLGDRGRYCIHNKLNELTGKEWIIYSKSFKIIQAPTLETFLEIVAEKQITFFTKKNQRVIELLSHSDSMKKVCEKTGRKYFSIPAKDDYFLGNFGDIDLSTIPKADFLISIPFNLITLNFERVVKGFITDYTQLVQNLISFYKLFLQCLRPKKYLSVIANTFYIEDRSFPFAFEFSSKFGKVIKQSDELVFIYDNQDENNKIPKNPYSMREHIYSFQFRNEKLPDSFKTLDIF
jgi:hypothetical protein